MPTYQYECRKCHHELEEFQQASDLPLTKCPSCKKNGLFRVLTGGLGFFLTGRTVGAVADKNTSTFSNDFKSHLKNKNKTKKVDVLSSKIKNKGEVVKQEKTTEKPWYKKNQTVTDKQLQGASPNQLTKYIETGKL